MRDMKRKIIITALAALMGFGLNAQTMPQGTRYDVLPVHRGGIIFAGDSITDDCEWNELFGRDDILNRGIDGNTSSTVLSRVNELTRHRPDKLFLAIGTNDLPRTPLSQVMDNISKIVETFRKESPETKIYIQSVLPVGPRPMFMDMGNSDEKNRLIVELNALYKDFCAKNGCTYIDNHSHFLASDGVNLNPELGCDDLHLMGKGYLVWKKNIEKYVNE